MDAKELIRMGKVAVRNSATAYPVYQTLFRDAFGFTPDCPTCGSVLGHKHWAMFEAFAAGADPLTLTNQNSTEMAKNFEVKNKSKIYSYTYTKKGRNLTARIYGDVMTESFAKSYLETAKDAEELQKRKMEFSKLPKGFDDDNVAGGTGAQAEGYPEKLAEKKALAAELGYPEEEYASIRSNADMIIYLDGKAIEADAENGADADAAASSEDLS